VLVPTISGCESTAMMCNHEEHVMGSCVRESTLEFPNLKDHNRTVYTLVTTERCGLLYSHLTSSFTDLSGEG
jgi:hypothetical protein